MLSLFFSLRPPPRSTLFPYTTLFRSRHADESPSECPAARAATPNVRDGGCETTKYPRRGVLHDFARRHGEDRKSTRLNSSHPSISYAVFCLKKKKLQPEANTGVRHTTAPCVDPCDRTTCSRCFSASGPPPDPHSFPTRRSSDLGTPTRARPSVRRHARRHRTCATAVVKPRSTPEGACFMTSPDATVKIGRAHV